MKWKISKLIAFKRNNDYYIRHLKDGRYYTCGNMVFRVRGDCEYDKNNQAGGSIPYYWLVNLDSEICYENSTLGLPKNYDIFYADDNEIRKAENILGKKQISFDNVRRLIIESKLKLDEAIQMLGKLSNGEQR